jgi:hypothetical protein
VGVSAGLTVQSWEDLRVSGLAPCRGRTSVARTWQVIALIVALMVVVSGCTVGSGPSASRSSPQSPDAKPIGSDPVPGGFDDTITLDARGGSHQAGDVMVEVPAGATASSVSVSVGLAIGPVATTYARETYGRPVRVEHTEPLTQPIRVQWDVSALDPEQRAAVLIVRWNDEFQAWQALDVRPTLDGESLSFETDQFSIIDWVSPGAAALSQTVGEIMGQRAKAPECPKNPKQQVAKLPAWVDGFVRPDEDQSAAPLRTCLETDKGEVITVRIADNRPYGQIVRLTAGAKAFAWTWLGEQDFTVAGLVVGALNQALSSDDAVLLGSVTTGAVGIDRPGSPGSHLITMSGHSSWQTILSDVLQFVLVNTAALDNVKGFDTESMNVFAQAMYDCAGKALLKSRDTLDRRGVLEVLDIIRRCADNDSVMNAIENVLRKKIAKGGDSARRAIAFNRFLKGALTRLAVYDLVAELASYTAELLTEAKLGPTTISLRGRGSPQLLGGWKPTCRDAAKDSDGLYRNLALQDEYADTSKELWQFKSWTTNAREAVKPLGSCSTGYIATLAQEIRRDWADPKAAEVVARAVERLTTAAVDKYGPVCDQAVGGTSRLSGAAPFEHPAWGHVWLVTCGATPDHSPTDRQGILVVDAQDTVRWRQIYKQDSAPYYRLEPASPVTDSTGNLFAIYNAGRYDGVAVLRPTATGMVLLAGVYSDIVNKRTPNEFYLPSCLGRARMVGTRSASTTTTAIQPAPAAP